MKAKKVLLFCLVSALLVAVIVWNLLNDYSLILRANWGVSIPSDANYTQIYEKSGEPSFHGDGIRYHVFSYKKTEAMESRFDWKEDPKEILSTVESWLDEIHVPSEQRPDSAEYAYQHWTREDGSEMIFLWSKETNRLYIIENLL